MTTRQLLLDTETTGFEPDEGHRIIELAALEMIDRKLTGNSLHFYFNPQRDIPAEATNIHGITLDQVQHEPTFKERAAEIINYIQGAELVIHNAKFDLKFLDHHFNELGKAPTLTYAQSSIDTLLLARAKFPGGKNSLDALCDRFNIDRSSRNYHGALVDCALLAHVYLELTREQISLLAEVNTRLMPGTKIFKMLPAELTCPVVAQVNEEEAEAHMEYLTKLNKVTHGKCLWYNNTVQENSDA